MVRCPVREKDMMRHSWMDCGKTNFSFMRSHYVRQEQVSHLGYTAVKNSVLVYPKLQNSFTLSQYFFPNIYLQRKTQKGLN